MRKFTHDMGDTVKLIESDENGTVTGRAEYDPHRELLLRPVSRC